MQSYLQQNLTKKGHHLMKIFRKNSQQRLFICRWNGSVGETLKTPLENAWS